MSNAAPKVYLKPRRARPFFARHPWVFVTSIQSVEGDPQPGDVVELHSHEKKFIGLGLFNPHSAIRVRLYRWEQGPLDRDFFSNLLESALKLRTETLRLDPKAGVRLVSSEGDGISGLTVDRYDRWLVAQFTSLALFLRREELSQKLMELTGAEGLLVRTERSTSEQEGLPQPFELVLGSLPVEPIEIVEHGLRYWVDPRAGQKTGFFLDQRDNRAAVARYSQGKKVLDLYSYTGAFALNAARQGATSVLGVDSSAVAVEVADHHAQLNGLQNVSFRRGDALATIEDLRASSEKFDVVICDPPKFAKSPKAIEDAVKGYLRLNRAALDVLNPDGILVTCSCSGLVDRALFADIVGQVAELSGRRIQLLEQRGQAPDHPVSASCLETEYLKCFVCRVG